MAAAVDGTEGKDDETTTTVVGGTLLGVLNELVDAVERMVGEELGELEDTA